MKQFKYVSSKVKQQQKKTFQNFYKYFSDLKMSPKSLKLHPKWDLCDE